MQLSYLSLGLTGLDRNNDDDIPGGFLSFVLTDEIVGSAANTLEVTGIPGDAEFLLVHVIARSDFSGAATGAVMRLNGDSGSNYDSVTHDLRLNSVTVNGATTDGRGLAQAHVGKLCGASTAANYFGSMELRIPGYADTGRFRTWTSQSNIATSGADADNRNLLNSGAWRNTANAITSIAIAATSFGGDDWEIGSKMIVVGIG